MKKKKELIIIVISVVLFVGLAIYIIISNAPEKAWTDAEAVEHIHEFASNYDLFEQDGLNYVRLGVAEKNSDNEKTFKRYGVCQLDIDLIKKYIQKYPKEEIIDLLFYFYNSDSYVVIDTDMVHQLLAQTFELSGIKTTVIKFDWGKIQKLDNKRGYYKGKKNSKDVEKVTGSFYDGGSNPPWEESRNLYTEYMYYGDWKIEYIHGYQYDEGEYGWSNGDFQDVPSKWVKVSDLYVYYRGDSFADCENKGLSALYNVNKSIRYIEYKGKHYDPESFTLLD